MTAEKMSMLDWYEKSLEKKEYQTAIYVMGKLYHLMTEELHGHLSTLNSTIKSLKYRNGLLQMEVERLYEVEKTLKKDLAL